MRRAVSSLTSGRVSGFSARDAVAGCTPARRATSRSVTAGSGIGCHAPPCARARARVPSRLPQIVSAGRGGRPAARPSCDHEHMRISAVTSTLLFRGTAARPRQIVQVTVVNDTAAATAPATVTVAGAGLATPEPAAVPALPPGGEHVAEVAIEAAAFLGAGSTRPVTVIAQGAAGRAEQAGDVTIAEPGWTMWMVSHFHYDPVWWSTQGQFLESRLLLPDDQGEMPEGRTAFELVTLHLDAARRDPDYKFVLAEIDYLKPHFDAHPKDRADLLAFIAA